MCAKVPGRDAEVAGGRREHCQALPGPHSAWQQQLVRCPHLSGSDGVSPCGLLSGWGALHVGGLKSLCSVSIAEAGRGDGFTGPG